MQFLELVSILFDPLAIIESVYNAIRWVRAGCPLSRLTHIWAGVFLLVGCAVCGIMVAGGMEFTVRRLLLAAFFFPGLFYAIVIMTYDPEGTEKKRRNARKRSKIRWRH